MNKLTQQERLKIFELKAKWHNNVEIGVIMKRHYTTIGRELDRNSNGEYDPIRAQKQYIKRKKAANKTHCILVKDKGLRNEVVKLLEIKVIDWSPDAIVWRKKEEWIPTICTKTIYNYIYNHEPQLKKHLKYKRWYRKYLTWRNIGKLDRTIDSIDNRPAIADTRKRIWDREGDTVVSATRSCWLVTFIERKTRYLLTKKIPNFKAETLHDATIKIFEKYHDKIKTITVDNGKEFADADLTGIYLWWAYYRAHPYHARERWTNENTNWMIRKMLPKWYDFKNVSDQKITLIQHKINKKPRRILKYASPYELFHDVKLAYFS